MNRREFIAIIGSAAAVCPLAAGRAQQPARLPTIGFLGSSSASAWSDWVAGFLQGMHEHGWFEGRTVNIEYRWADGRAERYGEIATEFVRLKVDVIVTVGRPRQALPAHGYVQAGSGGRGVASPSIPQQTLSGPFVLAPLSGAALWQMFFSRLDDVCKPRFVPTRMDERIPLRRALRSPVSDAASSLDRLGVLFGGRAIATAPRTGAQRRACSAPRALGRGGRGNPAWCADRCPSRPGSSRSCGAARVARPSQASRSRQPLGYVVHGLARELRLPLGDEQPRQIVVAGGEVPLNGAQLVAILQLAQPSRPRLWRPRPFGRQPILSAMESTYLHCAVVRIRFLRVILPMSRRH